MNYQHLYYFMVIAEEGSIARASERLRLGQPTLSAQLKQFERRHEIDLFERRHKRLVLTESGRIALDYAKQIFHLGNEMLETLGDRRVPQLVNVQLGMLDSIPKQMVLRLVQAAYQVQPCTVSILEGRGDELLRELINHRLDLLMTNFSPPGRGDMKILVKSVARLQVEVFGAEKFKFARKNFPRSLQQQPFIMPTHHSRLRADLEHHFQLAGITLNHVAETQDTGLQRWLAEAGVGMIASTRPGVEDLLKEKRLHHLGSLKGVFEEFYLINSSRRFENPVAENLIKNFKVF